MIVSKISLSKLNWILTKEDTQNRKENKKLNDFQFKVCLNP